MTASPARAGTPVPANSGEKSKIVRSLQEASGLLRAPLRVLPLMFKVGSDALKAAFEQRHLYSYASITVPSAQVLESVIGWMLAAQKNEGGIAAYYSLLSGYSAAYPEVTGYIIPTLYDYARETGASNARAASEQATRWLVSLQKSSGAFPGGLHGTDGEPSVFNTGQILQGLVRAHAETGDQRILESARNAGIWLAEIQQSDGSWSGPGAYQGVAHTYYSMVAWALAMLGDVSQQDRFGLAADNNIDWVLSHFRPSGWIDGINLQGHSLYLHFIAYVIQGTLEYGILRRQEKAIEAAAASAWVLLRKFETNKFLLGAYEKDFKGGPRFSCLTGNAQMSCVWARLYETLGDLRFLNSALKMNEMLKRHVRTRGHKGVAGGVPGSFPAWGSYQPLRYISWGCKFFADALMLEQRLLRQCEASTCA